MAAAKKIEEELKNTKPFTDSVSSIAHETVDRAAEGVGAAEESIRESASEAADRINDKKESVELEMGSLANQARKVVVENPLMAAGIAFTAGFLVTSLLSKKS